jgi:hypothetical protein
MPLVSVIDLSPKITNFLNTECSNAKVQSIVDFESTFINTDFDVCMSDLNEIVTDIDDADCYNAVPMSILPFRVAFITVDTGGYSPTNPAPIGIAVIGFTNYIL